jgi:hypothetical protein
VIKKQTAISLVTCGIGNYKSAIQRRRHRNDNFNELRFLASEPGWFCVQNRLLIIAAACCISLGANIAKSDTALIDDFTSNSENKWRFFADTVMGGVSSGSVTFKTENGKSFAQMTGEVSTANNGGFIQIRHQLHSPPPSGTAGVQLTVRGNAQRYFLHLRTSGTILPWQYYQAAFDTQSKWQEIRIPLTKFERSGWILSKSIKRTSIRSIAVVAFGRNHKADIQVRELSWY